MEQFRQQWALPFEDQRLACNPPLHRRLFHGCGQFGHMVSSCLNAGQGTTPVSPAEDTPDKVNQVSSAKALCDVCLPVKLFSRHTLAVIR